MKVLIVSVLVTLCLADDDDSYSFHEFRGPVSGEERQVVVNSPYGQTVDYVAKPDYGYSYRVHDPAAGVAQGHQETRDGDVVHGEYRVLQADGVVRVVKYTAGGDDGFQATVHYENAP